MRLRLAWYRKAWYIFLLTKRRALLFPDTLGIGLPSFWYFGKREPAGIDLCREDLDSANDSPHVFCYRFFRKFKAREYRFAIAEYTWNICLCLKFVNTLYVPLSKGRGLPMALGQSYG